MSVTEVLDDVATPRRLHSLRLAMQQASLAENRGQVAMLDRQYTELCTRIRQAVASFNGKADAELLICLWSTAQLSHAGGVEYARAGQSPTDTSPTDT
jgi:hypothetical protein